MGVLCVDAVAAWEKSTSNFSKSENFEIEYFRDFENFEIFEIFEISKNVDVEKILCRFFSSIDFFRSNFFRRSSFRLARTCRVRGGTPTTPWHRLGHVETTLQSQK